MKIHSITTRTVTLDSTDVKQAIIMYLKERGEKDISEKDIELAPSEVQATIILTSEIKPT